MEEYRCERERACQDAKGWRQAPRLEPPVDIPDLPQGPWDIIFGIVQEAEALEADA